MKTKTHQPLLVSEAIHLRATRIKQGFDDMASLQGSDTREEVLSGKFQSIFCEMKMQETK